MEANENRRSKATGPLHKNKVFWLAGVVPLIIAVTISVVIVVYSDFKLCGSHTCFSNLLDYYSLPIKILTAGFAAMGLIALIHRSSETQEQIRVTEHKNRYDLLLAHKKEFDALLTSLEEQTYYFLID